MKEVFDLIDSDKSGSLSLEEVVLHLKSITDDVSEEQTENDMSDMTNDAFDD